MPKPIPTSAPTTKSNLSHLQETLPLLHLLYRRNKNQHRSAPWFKWLSILRRNLTHLLAELPSPSSSDEGSSSSGSQQSRQNRLVDRAADRAMARVAHLKDYVVRKCYLYVLSVLAPNGECGLC